MKKIDYSFQVDGLYSSVSYYRSESPLEIDNMPSPVATNITGFTYSDTTAEGNRNYFVRFGSKRGDIEKFSDQLEISTFSSASIAFVGSGVIGAYSNTTAVTLPIPAHLAGDIIVIVARGATGIPVGYTQAINQAGLQVYYKIATQNQASQTTVSVPMVYGGASSIVLRPGRAISSCVFEYSYSQYANSTSRITTPALSSAYTDYFELNVAHWTTVTAGTVSMSNSVNGQALLASNGTPVQTGRGMNFIVSGTSKGTNNTNGLDATLSGAGYTPSSQTVNAYTIALAVF